MIAVFGGSFDPPHLAHTMAAAYVLAGYPVKRLLIVPTYCHPFDKPLADFEHRLQMCTLAMADLAHERVEISPVERDIGGKSLTLRTLQELRRQMPNAQLRLLVGSDILQETARWHQFDRVTELAPPIWLNRAGHPRPKTTEVPDVPDSGPLFPDISSTEIRRRIAKGQSTQGLLAHTVAAYIQSHGLYGS